MAAWILGTAAGAAANNGLLTVTGLPTLDSIIVAGVSFAAVRMLQQRRDTLPPTRIVEPLL